MQAKLKIQVMTGAGTGLIALGAVVLLAKEDTASFLAWYLMIFFMGWAFMPVTSCLLRGFQDQGWLFSKMLAIAATGFLNWVLVCCGLFRFSTLNCLLVVLIVAALIGFVSYRKKQTASYTIVLRESRLIFWEELLLLGVFLIWTYIMGFHPAAYGTEKFMDYGFMEAMMRSSTLPAKDLWYSEGVINYYYGGQYYAVFLTKITGTQVAVTYNLMRALIAAFAFALPFSLVYQIRRDQNGIEKKKKTKISVLSGLLAGSAVSLAGSMHYVIYSKILPLLNNVFHLNLNVEAYWFPSSTRYIGCFEGSVDNTIHEFPAYSFVLGDLHAHVINIIFVLLLIAILYEAMKKESAKTGDRVSFLEPWILAAGILIGIFNWNNYWDFVIYLVVTMFVILFSAVKRFRKQWKKWLIQSIWQLGCVAILSQIAALPFSLQFDSMAQGIALARHHSAIYQMLVVWALPVSVSVVFIIWMIRKYWKKNLDGFIQNWQMPNVFVVVIMCCACGLVLVPEVIYVKDIYEATHARANTMFKLAYQAFILFGIVMGYAIPAFLEKKNKKGLRIFGWVTLICLVSSVGYISNSVKAWYGDIFAYNSRQGLDATAFLETDFPEDAAAVRWLRAQVTGSPVVLEANGDSYTNYERVSAMTGLPTVVGWYVHEWLWRNNTDDLNVKIQDIQTIYTSAEEETVRNLLNQYAVSYIVVGSCEREKYGEALNNENLQKMGEMVFHDETSETYIIKVE